MARIRTIKPSFFKNEELAELPMTARILFIGLWVLADKEGRLEDRPKRIKAELFPYDNMDVDDLLSRLQTAGFINRYGFGDLKVIQILTFTKHQRITGSEASTKSDFPAYSKETNGKQLGNTEETTRTTGKEGKGRERIIGKEEGEEEEIPPPDLENILPDFLKKNRESVYDQVSGACLNMELFDDNWREVLQLWINYLNILKKPIKNNMQLEATYKQLQDLSRNDYSTAKKIVNQSMASNWVTLYELKSEKKGVKKYENSNEVESYDPDVSWV